MTDIRDLKKQLGHLNLLIAEAKEKEKAAALAAFRLQVEEYGITELELLRGLGFIKMRAKTGGSEYYDPDTGRRWSGKGRMPNWLKGRNPEDYRIVPTAKPWWPERESAGS
ncbi:H-NS family nucleoid-associated regulatory protein (plasmid) [Paraburkholderia sp. PREW-6R]|uniref:H-NS family nucleoid-associated regulatory protein n=1 Tax=Paraburkholderia sp. PREW-6R TaxID=3141544 RepID=UPI0031F49AAB